MPVRIIMDVKTTGFDNVIRNLRGTPELITTGAERRMKSWFNLHFKKEVEKIIRTGEPSFKIPDNRGDYADWKRGKYGFDHGLGVLTGRLLRGVLATRMDNIRVTRGREVRGAADFVDPFYAPFVHDGFVSNKGKYIPPRPFIELARDQTLPILDRSLSKMLDGLDYDKPYEELVSSVISSGQGYAQGVEET